MTYDFLNILRANTGHDWEWLYPLQTRFRLQRVAPLCVVTPGELAWLKYNRPFNKPGLRYYYAPVDHTGAYNLERFINHYLKNVKTQLAREWPAVQIDLDGWPEMQLKKYYGLQFYIVAVLKLTGDLTLRKSGSVCDAVITPDLFQTLSYDAQLAVNDYLCTLGISNCDLTKGTLTVTSSISSKFWTVNFSTPVTTGKTMHFQASAAPKPVEYESEKLGWKIEGKLGMEINGDIHNYLADFLPVINWDSFHIDEQTLASAITTLAVGRALVFSLTLI